MKLFATIAAGLVTMLGIAPAQAQVHRDRTTTVVTETRVVRDDRGPRYDRDRRGYRGRSHGYRNKRVCRNEWRGDHRRRVCRTIRVRR